MTQQNNYEPLTDSEIMNCLPDAVRVPPGWRMFAKEIEKAVLNKQARAIGGIRVYAHYNAQGFWHAVSSFEIGKNATLILDEQK